MTTIEANRLSDVFAARAAKARERGDKLAASIWTEAAADLLAAEGDSITASHERSKRRNATAEQREHKRQIRAAKIA